MLASCTTSRCAAWETIGSEDREMMWSHTSDSVLHWGGNKEQLEMYRLTVCTLQPRTGGRKLTTCRILFSVSYTEQSCRVTERVKLVIIGVLAVGGYKLGTYNPQHSHTDMHNQMQTPNKWITNAEAGRSLSLSLPLYLSASLSLSFVPSLTFFTPTFHFLQFAFSSSPPLNIVFQRCWKE